jgi:hypothetical protein
MASRELCSRQPTCWNSVVSPFEHMQKLRTGDNGHAVTPIWLGILYQHLLNLGVDRRFSYGHSPSCVLKQSVGRTLVSTLRSEFVKPESSKITRNDLRGPATSVSPTKQSLACS